MRTPLLALSLPMLALAACVPPLPEAKNIAPTAPTVSIGPDGARTGDDLVVVLDAPSTDPEGGTVSYAYAWKQDGLPRTDLVTDTVPASETTKGENREVTVTPNDGALDGPAATAMVTIANTPPVVTVAFSPEAPTTDDDVQAVATATDADGDTVTFTYAWTLAGGPVDNVTDTIPADATSHGERWAVTVTPADPDEAGLPVTAEVQIANSAPVMLSVTLVPDAPFVTDDIVAVVEASDADGDALTYTYTWFVDGAEVQSGPSDTLAGGGFAKHQRISVEVVPNDGFDDGEAFLSADAVALNSLPTATGASIDPASAYEASTLTCVPAGFADADGDAEGWSYSWSVNGAEVATTAMLDGTSFDKGDEVVCSATPRDGEESGAPVMSATLTIANTAPVLASVELSTTAPTESDTLSVTLGAASDDDGDAVSYSYDWFVNGINISVGSTLSASSFEKGDSLYVVVTPWDGSAWGAPVTSAVATAVNTPPTVASVTLSPSAVYTNDTLTASVSATDLDGDTLSYTYAWYVDGALVQSGASATLSGAAHFDRDEDVYVVVTPNDGEADGSSSTSSTVTVLNSAPTAPVVEITPEDAGEGDDLTCAVVTESSDADGDAVTYTFAWDVDGVDYTGATGSPTDSVVDGAGVYANEEWVCGVVASDGRGSTSASDDVIVAGGECLPAYVVGSSSGYATIANSSGGDFDFGSSLTVSVWVKVPASGSLDTTYIFGNSAQNIDCAGMALTMEPTGYFKFGDTNGTTSLYCAGDCDGAGIGASTSVLTRGVWHHIAFVQDASAGIYVYVDGTLESLDSCSLPINVMDPVRDMRVGRPLYYTRSMSQVAIADLSFWSRALSSTEVEQVASYAGASADISTGLVANIPFTEGSGTVAAETTGSHAVSIDSSAATWTATGPNCP